MSNYLADFGALLAAAISVFVIVKFNPSRGGSVRSVFVKASTRRTAVAFAVGLLCLTVNFCGAWVSWAPVPQVHDEFSYLLGGDTFARGRWTNPTHPLWEHFESFHTIQHPTYQSKYPPAQAVFLAIGQQLTGHPIAGVWLSLALACGATCWMLQAWLPARWALLGGLFAALHPRILEYWGQTYWGGAAAMLGGALVFGALRRLSTTIKIGNAITLAVGLVILANSRPYEGLVTSIPVAILLSIWLLNNKGSWSRVGRSRLIVPVAIILALGAGVMGYFHYRVTGDPLKTPYQAWVEQYAPQGSMSRIMFRYQPVSRQEPTRIISFPDGAKKLHPKDGAIVKCVVDWIFFVGASFAVPLLGSFLLLRTRRSSTSRLPECTYVPRSLTHRIPRIRSWTAFSLVTMGLVYAAYLAEWAPPHAHYVAPITCLFFFVVIQGLRHLYAVGRRPGSLGRALVVAVFPAISAALGITIWQRADDAAEWRRTERAPWYIIRDQIAKRLAADRRKHLIVVRYLPGHQIDDEWVYNGADIDDADVVWARELTPEKNDRLIEYFQDRAIWLLEPDAAEFRLIPHRNTSRRGESSTLNPT